MGKPPPRNNTLSIICTYSQIVVDFGRRSSHLVAAILLVRYPSSVSLPLALSQFGPDCQIQQRGAGEEGGEGGAAAARMSSVEKTPPPGSQAQTSRVRFVKEIPTGVIE